MQRLHEDQTNMLLNEEYLVDIYDIKHIMCSNKNCIKLVFPYCLQAAHIVKAEAKQKQKTQLLYTFTTAIPK